MIPLTSDMPDADIICVIGVTDIDDKIIARSQQSKQNWKELANFYEEEFFCDMTSLNVSKPYLRCRVTEYIPEIVQFVNNILSKEYAYVTKDGSVHFDSAKYAAANKLPFKELTSHSDVKTASDFVLWKARKEGEPSWKSPWGYGRPGWHIECSTIASTVLGSTIDLHSGGIDLAFPHHENEEIQSCSYHNVDQWVNYWLHTGHLRLKEDVKMSKSLHNTISIQEFLTQYSADQFRLCCLMSHYRKGIEYSHESMELVISTLKKMESFIDDCKNYVSGKLNTGNIDEPSLLLCLSNARENIDAALVDDFDTPKAIQEILNLIKVGNKMIHQSQNTVSSRNPVSVAAVSNYVTSTLCKFGLHTSKREVTDNQKMLHLVDDIVHFRNSLRQKALEADVKDKYLLNSCDEIRSILAIRGIEIKDHKQSSTWSMKE
ncbi:probable cysteine--tRNA ligase, mitochondrial isoform X2 [Orussus abietinus]|uniref:probable cysteine--tRNA ligase, mitochondrial isoform X2 n=1 Tax=Orussus abietinus TaxID=222816 RepID=UPI000625556A|nr:probable cysteine--tRNA ligase, mitochondrial isoform X2 [Orussus abietinus]